MPNNQKILNIGAGTSPMPDAVNLDIIAGEGIDKVCDITKGLPFQDQQFEKVVANYVLCQISSPEAFKCVLNEIWRVLKPDRWLELKVPNANFPAAFQDPMDCRRFVPETFDYFDKDHYRYTAFQYGFKPWYCIQVVPEREDRLFVKMRKSIRV